MEGTEKSVEVITGLKGQSNLCFDGYVYSKKTESPKLIRWRCVSHRRLNCNGAVTTSREMPYSNPTNFKEHSHPPDEVAKEVTKVRRRLREASMNLLVRPVQVLKTTLQETPDEVKKHLGKIVSLERDIRRQRQHLPPTLVTGGNVWDARDSDQQCSRVSLSSTSLGTQRQRSTLDYSHNHLPSPQTQRPPVWEVPKDVNCRDNVWIARNSDQQSSRVSLSSTSLGTQRQRSTLDYSHNHLPSPQTQRVPVREIPVDVNCGELRPSDAGMLVQIKGRVQSQGLHRFIQLRDSHGTTQLVALDERLDLIKRIRNIPVDSYIEIVGLVQRRPVNTINHAMATGEIEVQIEDILDVAAPKRKYQEPSGEEAPGRTGKKARSSILITSAEIARCVTPAVKRKFLERTHNCGELNETLVNAEVSLCGWVEEKRNDKFLTLRDGYGAAQLVINANDFSVQRVIQRVEPNALLVVKGKVCLRPSHQRNTRMATGDVEVKVNTVELIDVNEPEPAGITEGSEEQPVAQEASDGAGPPAGDVNSYTGRSHTCGQLRGGDAGAEVTLCGWLDSQRGSRFGTLRDGHGKTQILVPTELEGTLGKEMARTPLESVVKVVGTVCARPPQQVSEKLETGEIEVVVKNYTVLNLAKKDLPFIIRDHNKPKEPVRMRYRYLDLRYPDMQHRLRLRSRVLTRMREFLVNQRGFVEVETPTLFRRTPGGAQEYVVPTRLEDKFYSLVQSPQQLKQLLMVGSMDRYFQVARCYRDEGARPDRQPEFTQMDIELSFTDRDGVLALVTDLLKASWPEELQPLHTPFPVLSYHDAMHQYGSDKPDLSFDNKLIDISHLISEEKKECLPENLKNIPNFSAKALVFSHNHQKMLKDAFQECVEQEKEKGGGKAKLIQVKCSATKWDQELAKALPFIDVQKMKETLKFEPPGTVVVGIGKESVMLPLMGKLRQDVLSSPTSNFHFAWIVDFPLFLEGDDGNLESAHHPFTAPYESDMHLLESDPLKVRGLHYDLVLNGYEVGGGSVRIHDAELQTRILRDVLRIPTDTLDHLLEALRSGAPPHAGIALGMDRLLAVMTAAETIRDVIAFPKGVDGKDLLTGAPCNITDEERRLYHLLPKK